MADTSASVVDLSRLDREALEALVLTQQEKLLTRNSEIEHLKLIIAKLRRMMFGSKSEKIAREVEQLELKLEELETGEAARPPAAAPTSSSPRRKRQRRPLPEHLPRETHTHMPAEEACSACGGELSKLGEDVSEMLEYIPASFKVIRHVRPKMCCTRCDAIAQAPAPGRPIDRGLPGPGLLAHVLVSKYADHPSVPKTLDCLAASNYTRNEAPVVPEEFVKQVNPVVPGSANYFRHTNASQAFRCLQRFINTRFRRCLNYRNEGRGFGWKQYPNATLYAEA
jgi:Transposase C of IS166 homeodomain/zinc-finger binding domain of transposase IS66/Group II intron, maturase-specific domain